MKKIVSISLKVAAILLGVGILIIGIGLLVTGGDFSKLSNQKQVTKTEEVEAFTDISVETESGDVQVLPSLDDSYKVVRNEGDLYFYTVEVVDGCLKIGTKETRKWYQYIGFDFTKMEVKVYIPEGAFGELSIRTGGGDIEVFTTNTFSSMQVKTGSGDIQIKGQTCASLVASTSSGDVKIDGISCDTLTAETGSGDVDVKTVLVSGEVCAKTSSGDVKMQEVSCGALTVGVESGSIEMANTVSQGDARLHTSSGDIRLRACDAQNYDIETGSGSIKGSVLTEKIFMADTGSGDIEVPEGTSGGICKVKTGSGDIRLELYAE